MSDDIKKPVSGEWTVLVAPDDKAEEAAQECDRLNSLLLLVGAETYTKQFEELSEDAPDEDRVKLLIKTGLILAIAAKSDEDQKEHLDILFHLAKEIPHEEFVKIQKEVCELLGEKNG